jgi:hypothetical protein
MTVSPDTADVAVEARRTRTQQADPDAQISQATAVPASINIEDADSRE